MEINHNDDIEFITNPLDYYEDEEKIREAQRFYSTFNPTYDNSCTCSDAARIACFFR